MSLCTKAVARLGQRSNLIPKLGACRQSSARRLSTLPNSASAVPELPQIPSKLCTPVKTALNDKQMYETFAAITLGTSGLLAYVVSIPIIPDR